MSMFRKLMVISGVAIATAVFPAVAQQGQQPALTEDHGAHHGGTDQQPGQQATGSQMMGGMMGSGQQGTMGSGMPGMGMGGCPMMGGMMGSGMGMGGQQAMMGSAMQVMGPGMRGLFGSRVMPMMNLSVDDVRGYLAVQLDLLNNKRLKIGEVKSDNGTITADIITVDNSLVQRLKVNQHTGVIEYQN